MTNTPKARQKWIENELRLNPLLSYLESYAKYSQNFARTRKTFDGDWKKAVATHKEYQSKLNNAKDEVSIGIELESIKTGLKSKLDRLMFYQNQIDEMQKQLTGASRFMFIVGNKPVASHNSKGDFILPLEKQNDIRKAIKEYQTEISKIEGDYAITKPARTHILQGNNEKPIAIKVSVTKEEIKQISDELEKEV